VELNRRYITGYQDINGIKIPEYRFAKETVSSTVATYLFSIDIRMLNIEKGTLIHNENKTYKYVYEIYNDNKPDNFLSVAKSTGQIVSVFPTMEELLNQAGKDFSGYFAKKIAPYSVTEDMSFEIISGDKINERFIRYIKSDLYDEALELMNDSLGAIKNIEDLAKRSKHYYNIGCIYEIKSDFAKSQEFYSKAVKDDPSELHLDALKAIKDRVKLQQKLDDQLKKDEDE
jgi:tetratricopeptide (TPR) repeat protein